MFVGELKVTPGIEATWMFFCPLCHWEMRHDDALGQIEAELIPPVTFEEVQAHPNTIGTIHAEIEDD